MSERKRAEVEAALVELIDSLIAGPLDVDHPAREHATRILEAVDALERDNAALRERCRLAEEALEAARQRGAAVMTEDERNILVRSRRVLKDADSLVDAADFEGELVEEMHVTLRDLDSLAGALIHRLVAQVAAASERLEKIGELTQRMLDNGVDEEPEMILPLCYPLRAPGPEPDTAIPSPDQCACRTWARVGPAYGVWNGHHRNCEHYRGSSAGPEPERVLGWKCSGCGWSSDYGEAAFTMAASSEPYCPTCKGVLSAGMIEPEREKGGEHDR